MDTATAVAARINELCSKYSITIYRLSKKSGVPHATIQSILDGKSSNPGTETIRKICNGFGISLSEFFDSLYFSRED